MVLGAAGVCAPWLTMPDDPTAPVDALMPASDLDWSDPRIRAVGVACAEAASAWLNGRKGGAYPGTCSATSHVCVRCGCTPGPLAVARPASGAPTWVNCGGCGTGGARVRLPNQPVVAVSAVTVDGVALDPDEYRVEQNEYLVRCGGTWPTCPPAACAGAGLVVAWTYGVEPPIAGRLAACALTLELAKHVLGHKGALGTAVTSASRQGTSVARDALGRLEKGKTGILLVDLFLVPPDPAPAVVLPEDVVQRAYDQGFARW